MSVVIVGGNDRMERQYIEACRACGAEAKVFTQGSGKLRRQIGTPDLLVLFTGTVSHEMASAAVREASKSKIALERSHRSSLSALQSILKMYC